MFFFAIFCDFGSILGGPGPSKNQENSPETTKRSIWGSVLDASLFEGGFGEGFERILVDFRQFSKEMDHIVDSCFAPCRRVRSMWLIGTLLNVTM